MPLCNQIVFQLRNEGWMTELEHHHSETQSELMDLGINYQWLLASERES